MPARLRPSLDVLTKERRRFFAIQRMTIYLGCDYKLNFAASEFISGGACAIYSLALASFSLASLDQSTYALAVVKASRRRGPSERDGRP